jgi:serine protease Do
VPSLHYRSAASGNFVMTGSQVHWVPRMGLGGLGGIGDVPVRSAVRLASVLPDSPAAKAGLKAGNEIVAVDGRGFAGARGFARALARRRPGEEVRLTVKDVAEPVKVLLVDREQEGRDLATAASVGLTVQALTPDLIAFLELPADTRGVVVRSVADGSPAADNRIQRGDVFLTDDKDGAPIRDQDELDAILGAAQGSVILRGRRGQQNTVFNLTLPTRVPPRKTR